MLNTSMRNCYEKKMLGLDPCCGKPTVFLWHHCRGARHDNPRQVPIEVLPYAPPYSGTIFLI